MRSEVPPAIATPIPLSVPTFEGNEARYLEECIRSGWVADGPFIRRFEEAVAARTHAENAVATSSGTAALHVALLLAGVRPGDLVLVPDLTFIATVNAVRYCEATPLFVDVSEQDWQLDPQALRAVLEERGEMRATGTFDRETGRPIRAVLAVHLLGFAAPRILLEVAQAWGIRLVQDAAQALGVLDGGRPVGGEGLLALSFNGNKIVTSAGGGMVLTDAEAEAERARYLVNQAKDDAVRFRHDNVGFNYRLSNLHAAVGLAQLEGLDGRIERKRVLHRRYTEAIADAPGVEVVPEPPGQRASFWLTTVRIRGEGRRDAVLDALRSERIEARPPWRLNHRQVPYRDCPRGALEVAPRLEAEGLHLPSSLSLSDAEQDRVVESLRRALRG